jgi:hypothetical protein
MMSSADGSDHCATADDARIRIIAAVATGLLINEVIIVISCNAALACQDRPFGMHRRSER